MSPLVYSVLALAALASVGALRPVMPNPCADLMLGYKGNTVREFKTEQDATGKRIERINIPDHCRVSGLHVVGQDVHICLSGHYVRVKRYGMETGFSPIKVHCLDKYAQDEIPCQGTFQVKVTQYCDFWFGPLGSG